MSLFSFTPNTKIKSSEENANWDNFSSHGRNFTMKWTFPDAIAVGVATDYLSLPDDGTIDRVDLAMGTAPTGAAVIVDIERSTDGGGTWTTIFTNTANRPQVAISAKTGNTTTIDVPAATANSHLYRAKISQIGSTIPGSDLSVMVRGKYNLD